MEDLQNLTNTSLLKLRTKKREPLTDQERIKLCQLIGTFHTNDEIKKEFVKIGKPLSDADLYNYKDSDNKWAPMIKKFRDDYIAYLPNIPLANKVKRVECLSRAYERAIDIEDSSETGGQKLDCIDREVKILDQIQKELEPKNIENNQNNFYFTQVTKFESMSREEFDLYRLNLVDKIKRYKELPDAR